MSKAIFLLLLMMSLPLLAQSQNPEIFATADGAIRGFDVVAYFKEGKAVKGNDKFTTEWKSSKWKFSSTANLEEFKKSPEKYAPQFGGFCAYGVADGHKSPTEPEAWTIIDGKLYMNYNLSVRKLWTQKPSEFIKEANAKWPALKGEK